MKVKFSKSVPYTPEWNGNTTLPEAEQIVAILTPLPMGLYLDLVDSIQAAGLTGKVDTAAAANIGKMRPIVKAAAEALPAHVELRGLVSDGPVTIQDVVGYPAFLGLATELLMKLVEISSPSEADEGN